MHSVQKGNILEDKFYQFLIDQQKRGDFVFGVHSPQLCKIHKKKKYFCKERKDDVEFDVVIELYGEGRPSPHMYIIFECKNRKRRLPETSVTDFTSKLSRIFGNSAKGVIVTASALQSGAENLALSAGLGIVKYTDSGFDIKADRLNGDKPDKHLFVTAANPLLPKRSLRFSAFYDGNYYSSVDPFLNGIQETDQSRPTQTNQNVKPSCLSLSRHDIEKSASDVLDLIDYLDGAVDLPKICQKLSIDLEFRDEEVKDDNLICILGSANFDQRKIQINRHKNHNRKRFTVAHEIGHFYLKHDYYLRSETVIQSDLLLDNEVKQSAHYGLLEFQANTFAAGLLLPERAFKQTTKHFMNLLGIRDRGHGYIFVDDQPCNLFLYGGLLSQLSTYFEASKQAIEIRLKNLRMLNDLRDKA